MIKLETYVVGMAGQDCPPVPLGALLDRLEAVLGARVAVSMPTVSQRLRIRASKGGRTARVVVHEEKLHAMGDDLLKKELKSAIEAAIGCVVKKEIESERN